MREDDNKDLVIYWLGSEVGSAKNYQVGGGPAYLDAPDTGIGETLERRRSGSKIERFHIDCPPQDGRIADNIRNLTSSVVDYYSRIAEQIMRHVAAGYLPIVLGGGHDISHGTVPGAVMGLRARLQNANARLGVLILDAHLDFNTNDTTRSHNLHGMPVASFTGRGHKALVRIGQDNHVDPENTLIVGVNDTDPGETIAANESGLNYITIDTFKKAKRDLNLIMNGIDHLCETVDGLYIGVDVDGIHSDDSPGTPMRNSDGLRKAEGIAILHHARASALASGIPVVGMEIVEVSPERDVAGKTKKMALEMIEKIIL